MQTTTPTYLRVRNDDPKLLKANKYMASASTIPMMQAASMWYHLRTNLMLFPLYFMDQMYEFMATPTKIKALSPERIR